jgi:hypothetical protein
MSDIYPNISKNAFNSRIQTTEPSSTYTLGPCGPSKPRSFDSDLKRLFPIGSENTIPAMGGSVVKISLADASTSINKNNEIDKYTQYSIKIMDKAVEFLNDEAMKKILNTSSLRTTISKILLSSTNSDFSADIVPNLYFSSTMSDKSEIDSATDYFGIIKKNAKFTFVPAEAMNKIAELISSDTLNGKPVVSVAGSWKGLSGRTFYETWTSLKSLDQLIDDDTIYKIILDLFPFFNLKEKELFVENPNIPNAGYFTIINNSIYLKMPDFSGFDSAGYGTDLFYSGVNFYFQLIDDDQTFSVRNISIEVEKPIYANIESYDETFDLKGINKQVSITLSSSDKPNTVYLSPVNPDGLKVKNDLLRGLITNNCYKYTEFFTYPNPYASIISIGKATKYIYQPFSTLN